MSLSEEEEVRGHPVDAFVGISEETERGPATLEQAIHDAALQAARNGFANKPVRIVHIEFTAHNPHITQYKVIASPGTGT